MRPLDAVAVYHDGGCRNENGGKRAGWGFVAIRKKKVLAEGWGPVRLDETSPEHLGTTKPSNNTGAFQRIRLTARGGGPELSFVLIVSRDNSSLPCP